MNKYKIGDRVKVRDDIKVGEFGVVDPMLDMAGKICTIKTITDIGNYTLAEDPNWIPYIWNDGALEPAYDTQMCFGVVDEEIKPHAITPKEVAFEAITAAMLDTYIRKNHDYGDSFGEGFKEFGLMSSVIRLGDKYRRLKSLCKADAQVQDESIKDTLLDLANYAVMTLVELG